VGAYLGFFLAAVLYLLAVAQAWRVLGRAPRGRARVQRALLVVVAAAGAPYLQHGLRLGERSSWQCDLCGRVEHRDAFAGIVLRRTPCSDPRDREVLDTYAAWANPWVGAHAHAWDATLSFHRFPGIACTMLEPGRGWFERLPRARPDLAQRALAAFIAADLEQRRRFRHQAGEIGSDEDFERWIAETFP
jgi:hypothetical protein